MILADISIGLSLHLDEGNTYLIDVDMGESLNYYFANLLILFYLVKK